MTSLHRDGFYDRSARPGSPAYTPRARRRLRARRGCRSAHRKRSQSVNCACRDVRGYQTFSSTRSTT
jgi:hypothetical protein